MKKTNSIVFGILLIFCGVLFGLHALGIFELFDGWWTAFIIIPCAVGIFTGRNKIGNLVGVLVGVVLLLVCLDVFDYGIVEKLFIPAVIAIVGVCVIANGFRDNKAKKIVEEAKADGCKPKILCAAFSGSNANFAGETFEGADITAVFGGAECDLRGAIIEKDTAIKVLAVFGGVDIFVPENINVKVNSTSIFGGVDNKTEPKSDTPTLYINAVCIFGGTDVK